MKKDEVKKTRVVKDEVKKSIGNSNQCSIIFKINTSCWKEI